MNIASIDIGTNTILMLLADIDEQNKTIKTVKNFQEIPRLGKGLKPGKPFDPGRKQMVLEILQKYHHEAKLSNCSIILASGTYPFRTASDSLDLIQEIKSKIGIEVSVLSGEEEAELAYLGAAEITSTKLQSVIIDIGGGSTEIVIGIGDKITYRNSFKVGAVSLTEQIISSGSSSNFVHLGKTVKSIFVNELPKLSDFDAKVIAIAGTPTTLACMKAGIKTYDEEKISGSVLYLQELEEFLKQIAALSPDNLLYQYGNVVKGREDVLFAGTLLLLVILSTLNVSDVHVSTKGIRYGAVRKYCLKTFGRYFEL